MFAIAINLSLHGGFAQKVIERPTSPETWTADDVAALCRAMCALLRPDPSEFIYGFPTEGDRFRVLVSVDEDNALTADALPLRPAVVVEMLARSTATFTDPGTERPQ